MSPTAPCSDYFLVDVPDPLVLDHAVFRPWRLRALTAAEFAALGGGATLSYQQLVYLAHLNLLAPTSHNTVPQRFQLGDGILQIWLDRTMVLSESDPSGRQAAVSLGCGIANLQLGARCFGWEAQVALLAPAGADIRPFVAGEPRYVAVAQITFERTEALASETWLKAMLQRRVIRAEYDESRKLPEQLSSRLAATVAAHKNLQLHWLTDAPSLLFLGKFQEIADTTVFNRDGFARELGNWLLPNDSDSPLGMRGFEFGLNDAAAARVHLGLKRELRLLPDEISGFAKAGNIGMRSAAAVAVICVESDDIEQQVAAGRAYEEMALLLTKQGWATAMHAGITEVQAPNLALRARLRTKHRPCVVFRVGVPLRPEDGRRPHSARPRLSDLMLPR